MIFQSPDKTFPDLVEGRSIINLKNPYGVKAGFRLSTGDNLIFILSFLIFPKHNNQKIGWEQSFFVNTECWQP